MFISTTQHNEVDLQIKSAKVMLMKAACVF